MVDVGDEVDAGRLPAAGTPGGLDQIAVSGPSGPESYRSAQRRTTAEVAMADYARTGMGVFEAWERRDFDALVQVMSDGVVVNDVPRNLLIKGKSEVKDWFHAWVAACPDSTAGATLVAAADDVVVIQGVWQGRNTGSFGPMAPTGRSIAMPWVGIARLTPPDTWPVGTPTTTSSRS
jgi:ketosteroid isomerase-like protein